MRQALAHTPTAHTHPLAYTVHFRKNLHHIKEWRVIAVAHYTHRLVEMKVWLSLSALPVSSLFPLVTKHLRTISPFSLKWRPDDGIHFIRWLFPPLLSLNPISDHPPTEQRLQMVVPASRCILTVTELHTPPCLFLWVCVCMCASCPTKQSGCVLVKRAQKNVSKAEEAHTHVRVDCGAMFTG